MLAFSKALAVSRALSLNWLPESMLKREDLSLLLVFGAEIEVGEVKTSQHVDRLDDGSSVFGLEVDHD